MLLDIFCCPNCKGTLSRNDSGISCSVCGTKFDITNGVADFFVGAAESPDDRNRVWLCPEVAGARDTKYRLCTRQLKGMTFCMREISQRTFPGCRVLEVGMGTGHFTRWLAEVSKPGTEIYAFDYSWPMVEKAKVNTQGFPDITFFRANARGILPFKKGTFDIVFLRLAPLGPSGMPTVRAAFELLKPGGWYFEAAWERERAGTPPAQWATNHGFEDAEFHVWRYRRMQSEEEYFAGLIDAPRSPYEFVDMEKARAFTSAMKRLQGTDEGIPVMTEETLLIARKPG